jgi:hypothetical protein
VRGHGEPEIALWTGWLAEADLASGQPAEADALAARLDLPSLTASGAARAGR